MCLCHAPGSDPAHNHTCRCGAPRTLAAMRRVEAHLSRRDMLGGAGAVLAMFAGFGLPRPARGQTQGKPLLLTNLRIFDGRNLALRADVDLLIQGDRVADLVPRGQGPAEADRIDGGGRVLMPGLIDAHWHATLVGVTQLTALTADISYVMLVAAKEAEGTLRRGFTTVRDTGGPVFALKQAIDEGLFEGPRIFPSGAMVSQTSGHGDFRLLHELPRSPDQPLSYAERVGVSAIADGRDLVLMRVREQLMKGASQVKMMAGGGASSLYDPLESVQYTEDELRAGVQAAADWGTYVCVHVYVPEGIQRAIRAGVRCIEHGQLTDEETARMMAGEGVWWSLQPFLDDADANVQPDPRQAAKKKRVTEGTANAYRLAGELGVRTVFGSDILMTPGLSATQGRQLAKLTRFMSPLAALRSATGDAGELLALSGGRAPYAGALGTVEKGALADLLVVDGEPETDLSFLADPETSLRLIMKGGRIVKQTL